MRARPGWLKICLALVALDLVFLGYEIREYGEEEAISRLAGEATLESLTEAVERGDEMRDRLLTNLGNHYLRHGLQLRSVAEVRAAVAYYQEALRMEPGLLEARHNLELARRVLESAIPPREPREPLPPDMIRSSEMPLKPNDI